MIVFLIGFMGCGKTTTGKKLAKKLGYNFLDLDIEIVLSDENYPTIVEPVNTAAIKASGVLPV